MLKATSAGRGVVLVCATVMALPAIASAAAAEPKVVPGKVEQVTLYRGQAMVVRSMELSQEAGAIEMVVTDLPQQVVAESLFAEGSPGIEVRAVRFRRRAVGQEPRQEVRELDEQIQGLNDDIAVNEQSQQLAAKQASYLDNLDGFVASTAKSDLARGQLDAQALTTITEFSFQHRKAATKWLMELRRQQRQLKQELSVLQRNRAEITKTSAQFVHEAVLFLDKKNGDNESVRLNYLVNNCGWSPAYNFRADSKDGKVDIEYNAVVRQMSGEDWSNVALTLSTASPVMSAAGPKLAPFHVMLAPGAAAREASAAKILERARANQRAQFISALNNTAATTYQGNFETSWGVNVAANSNNTIELTAPTEALGLIRREAPGVDQGPSLSYPLEGKVSLASRSDQQMIRIMQTELPSQFYYVASPILTTHVYRESALKNQSERDLLGGPVSVYLDGRFVGRTEIVTVARGQTFVVGFGADPQLRTSREMLDREQTVQGGNQVVAIQYRLVVENYKDTAVPVRVQDRLPYAGITQDLRVTLEDEMEDALSKDPLYLRLDRPKGILRWDVEVPASASGEKAHIIKYGYRLEFDRNLQLQNPEGGQSRQLQEEFFEHQMQLQRF